jgi:alpha-mannosidase
MRLVEMDGHAQQDVRISFAAPLVAAREVNSQEMPLGGAKVIQGKLATSFAPYQLRTFALKLKPARVATTGTSSQEITILPFSRLVASKDGARSTAGSSGFDVEGHALPTEMLPAEISYSAINFHLASAPNGGQLAVVAKGQTIRLPLHGFKRLYLLAASAEGDQKATFRIGNAPEELTIQDWSGLIGQWDDRTWNQKQEQLPPRPGAPPNAPPRVRAVLEYTGLKPGFIKRAPVAWFASHRHTAEGANEPYAYSYLFAYSMAIPGGAHTLTLPDNDKIRILAITVSDESTEVRPAQPLYDTLQH